MRFLLVDRVTRLDPGSVITGHKNWSLANDVFNDHFPGIPVVPGVLLVESLAQLLGFLLEGSYRAEYGDSQHVGAVLSIIHKAKFRRLVVPGDRVDMEGELTSLDFKRASCKARGRVDGELRVQAELSFVWHKQAYEDVPPELKLQRDSYARAVLGDLRAGVKDTP